MNDALTRCVTATVFVLLLATDALAQKSDHEIALAVRPFVDIYQQCVMAQAKRFASSRESAEFIVKVAVQSCEKDRAQINSVAISEGAPPWLATGALVKIDKKVEQMASMTILELRAK